MASTVRLKTHLAFQHPHYIFPTSPAHEGEAASVAARPAETPLPPVAKRFGQTRHAPVRLTCQKPQIRYSVFQVVRSPWLAAPTGAMGSEVQTSLRAQSTRRRTRRVDANANPPGTDAGGLVFDVGRSGRYVGPSPQIGNFSQSLVWGRIDGNVPPVLGNGDIGGLFDPFGGTTYDELRFGSGGKRDIRTLFLTQVMLPDYWLLEDQSTRFLDPRYYRPAIPRRYLTLGAPFTCPCGPTDAGFPEKLADHRQTLDIAAGRLTSRYRVGEVSYTVETIILPDESVIAYRVIADAPMRFEIAAIASPEVTPPGNPANTRYQQTRNGYHAYESEANLIVLKQVSNTFCPAYAAVSVPVRPEQQCLSAASR